MPGNVLTPFQKNVLFALFDKGLAKRGYYLTGGTALTEFYLQHRYSDDLDFFTRKKDFLKDEFKEMRQILSSMGLVVDVQVMSHDFLRCFVHLEEKKEEQLKIEFCRDAGIMMATPKEFGPVLVDSFEDIAVNKVCAILGRSPSEPKDFCDLFFILTESRFDLDYLVSRAREKDATFDNDDGVLMFATNLLTVKEFQILPRMIKSLTLNELRDFFVPVAEKLINRFRPTGCG